MTETEQLSFCCFVISSPTKTSLVSQVVAGLSVRRFGLADEEYWSQSDSDTAVCCVPAPPSILPPLHPTLNVTPPRRPFNWSRPCISRFPSRRAPLGRRALFATPCRPQTRANNNHLQSQLQPVPRVVNSADHCRHERPRLRENKPLVTPLLRRPDAAVNLQDKNVG